ncbi:ClbS/DfsB family four-helix bundle protein [Nesterenkonia flava]|uniref:ClbS/DfsB family four-helix bundle protein n=1 Tax=Nesterenkonia flava TaxID=469799 RepID=A0ABU1FS44_9MICC|nr:ClbS/DfsB family four-helix bundle protein [Nesterenkonia flava]MDR5711493.1 ClbS/DfsB family four-helix bundle protein [Nesterenkonia flava]
MAVPQSKVELQEAIRSSYDKLAADLARVPEAMAREASMPGHKTGSLMSPADLVAYLVGWDELVLSWHAQRNEGRVPELPAPGYSWNALGDLALKFYADHAKDSSSSLLRQLETAKTAILELVDGLDDAELYGEAWYGKYTAGRMIQLNTSSPYSNARTRVRAWLREHGL